MFGTFQIRGAIGTSELIADAFSAPVLLKTLPAGSYEIELLPGWELQQEQSIYTYVPVPAHLVANSLYVEVSPGATTQVSFLFETAYGPLPLTKGQVEISIQVVRHSLRVIDVSAGVSHTCALYDDGNARCWGWNPFGQLGYGDTQDIGDDEPVSSVGFLEHQGMIMELAPGGNHTCARFGDGTVRCWGANPAGKLGYGDAVPRESTPALVPNVATGGYVEDLAAGQEQSCVRLRGGDVRCWGEGRNGQLGYGNIQNVGDDELPETVGPVDVGGRVWAIATGFLRTCALLETGAVRCWGMGSAGGLGYGNAADVGDDETPASVGDIDLGGRAVQISVGWGHMCALLDTGAVRCWGANESGQLGYGHTQSIGDDETPASAGDIDLGGRAIQVSTGGAHTCALLETGAVRCWGLGETGLGYGNQETIGDDETPASAGDVDLGGRALKISAGAAHTCALLESYTIRCWGFGHGGRLGYGNTANIGDDETPASVGDVPAL